MPLGQQTAGDVVEPEALAHFVEFLGRFHLCFLGVVPDAVLNVSRWSVSFSGASLGPVHVRALLSGPHRMPHAHQACWGTSGLVAIKPPKILVGDLPGRNLQKLRWSMTKTLMSQTRKSNEEKKR